MDERRSDIGQRAVIGAVIRRLYFGNADRKTIAMNGRILRDLHRKGYDWPTLLRMVEGLAVRRDGGELRGVGRQDPVSLRWCVDKDQTLNQVAVCLDAAAIASAVQAKQAGGTKTLADILKEYGKGA